VSALGGESPLMQAPLGRGAAARLAIEVSEAGGVGTLGASWTEPGVLGGQIRSIARVTDPRHAVNPPLATTTAMSRRWRCTPPQGGGDRSG
jgi:NAD(P)H-dependent flavin oxidoreductase YrpB (nitropropane dioxygenase family)